MNAFIRRRKSLAAALATVLSMPLLLPALATNGARDLFYQQLNSPKPAAQTNVGMSYWIELVRHGNKQRVDSRFQFQAGDHIKFHITPNIDGFCHILMIGGTTGSKDVLFPVAGLDTSNAVHRGKTLTVPSSSFLIFDNHPGREHVRIALSRQNKDSSTFLEQQSTKVAMATISPNPAVDPSSGHSNIMVSFKEDIPKPKPVTIPASSPPRSSQPVAAPTNDTAIENAIPNDEPSKDLFREGISGSSSAAAHHVAHHASHAVHHTTYRPATVYTPPPPPSTVVLNANANEDLYADISLEHS